MKNPRNIKYIVVHCTATQPDAKLESIKKYWKEVRGWGDIPGYHYIIDREGDLIQLLDEKQESFGSYGHNKECVHVGYIGGIKADGTPFDNRTFLQREAMFDILMRLSEKYPKAQIMGHRDFPGVKKACPSFDVKKWLNNYVPDIGLAA